MLGRSDRNGIQAAATAAGTKPNGAHAAPRGVNRKILINEIVGCLRFNPTVRADGRRLVPAGAVTAQRGPTAPMVSKIGQPISVRHARSSFVSRRPTR